MEQTNQPDSTVSSCTGEKSCCFSLDCVPPCVKELLMWRDVKKTAPVFVGGLILLYLLAELSLISVVAYTGLLVLAGAAVCKALHKFAPKVLESTGLACCACPAGGEKKCEVTREQAEHFVDKALPHANATMAYMREVFLVTNPLETAKFALLFWILTYVGACFNLITLIIVLFVLAFSAPRIYEQFQPQFDNLGALIKAHLGQVCKLVHQKIEEAKQKVRDRTKKEKAQ